jgi:hypothetical protein
MVFTIKEDRPFIEEEDREGKKPAVSFRESFSAFYENIKDIFSGDRSLFFILFSKGKYRCPCIGGIFFIFYGKRSCNRVYRGEKG